MLWLVSTMGIAADGSILRPQFICIHWGTGCYDYDARERYCAGCQIGRRRGVGDSGALDPFSPMRPSVSRRVAISTRANACGAGTRAVAVVIGRGVWFLQVG